VVERAGTALLRRGPHRRQEVAQGLDLQAQHQAIRSALRAHEPTVESLSIRVAGTSASQELLWRRLAEQARQTTFNAEDRLNQSIVAEACAGNLGRLAELTTLSLKGAGCLAESGTQELFLNRVNQLSPLAAQKLAEWPGRWLCLNGLKRLPPETARELFAWTGEWISLNGLSEMAPEAGRYVGVLPKPRPDAGPITYYVEGVGRSYTQSQTAEQSAVVVEKAEDCGTSGSASCGWTPASWAAAKKSASW